MGQLRIALRSEANRKFVCADLNEQGHLVADRDAAQAWETFDVCQVNPDGSLTPVPDTGMQPPPQAGGVQPLPQAGPTPVQSSNLKDHIDLALAKFHSSPSDIASWPITRG